MSSWSSQFKIDVRQLTREFPIKSQWSRKYTFLWCCLSNQTLFSSRAWILLTGTAVARARRKNHLPAQSPSLPGVHKPPKWNDIKVPRRTKTGHLICKFLGMNKCLQLCNCGYLRACCRGNHRINCHKTSSQSRNFQLPCCKYSTTAQLVG